jgi:agmatinase
VLSGPFLSKNWSGACEEFAQANWVMVGLPYDGTCSYRPGTRFGPEMIRLASWGLEEFSPYQKKDLSEISFYDAGELDLPIGDRCLSLINETAKEVLSAGKKWIGIGGEHLVTYPAVKAYAEKYPDLYIIHFDAHADLREDYLGEKLSHATVMRRISDIVSPYNLIQIGIRSGTKEEFQWMQDHNTLIEERSQIPDIIKRVKNNPIFISIDLDVLDPGIMSGTGTPEAGGMSFNELLSWLFAFSDLNITGADVVELSPHYDPSGVSTAMAAKVIRELLLLK